MFFWLLVGLVLGYFFKPQIDRLLRKMIGNPSNRGENYYRDRDRY
jgi:hypothetical protein